MRSFDFERWWLRVCACEYHPSICGDFLGDLRMQFFFVWCKVWKKFLRFMALAHKEMFRFLLATIGGDLSVLHGSFVITLWFIFLPKSMSYAVVWQWIIYVNFLSHSYPSCFLLITPDIKIMKIKAREIKTMTTFTC